MVLTGMQRAEWQLAAEELRGWETIRNAVHALERICRGPPHGHANAMTCAQTGEWVWAWHARGQGGRHLIERGAAEVAVPVAAAAAAREAIGNAVHALETTRQRTSS